MITLDQFINRLQELQSQTEGDVPVVIIHDGEHTKCISEAQGAVLLNISMTEDNRDYTKFRDHSETYVAILDDFKFDDVKII